MKTSTSSIWNFTENETKKLSEDFVIKDKDKSLKEVAITRWLAVKDIFIIRQKQDTRLNGSVPIRASKLLKQREEKIKNIQDNQRKIFRKKTIQNVRDKFGRVYDDARDYVGNFYRR